LLAESFFCIIQADIKNSIKINEEILLQPLKKSFNKRNSHSPAKRVEQILKGINDSCFSASLRSTNADLLTKQEPYTRSEVAPPRETRQSQHRLAILNGPSPEIQFLLHICEPRFLLP
jgi:hypothetical protein